jgi:hypothetical protein
VFDVELEPPDERLLRPMAVKCEPATAKTSFSLCLQLSLRSLHTTLQILYDAASGGQGLVRRHVGTVDIPPVAGHTYSLPCLVYPPR